MRSSSKVFFYCVKIYFKKVLRFWVYCGRLNLDSYFIKGGMIILEKLISIEMAAKVLEYAPKTVRDKIRAGKMPGVKFRSRWYMREADLITLTEKKEKAVLTVDPKFIDKVLRSANITADVSQLNKITETISLSPLITKKHRSRKPQHISG